MWDRERRWDRNGNGIDIVMTVTGGKRRMERVEISKGRGRKHV